MIVDDFKFPVELELEFTQNNIPFMAQTIATVEKGKFKGTQVIVGMKGLMFQIQKDGEYHGYIGFAINTLLSKAIEEYLDKLPLYQHDQI